MVYALFVILLMEGKSLIAQIPPDKQRKHANLYSRLLAPIKAPSATNIAALFIIPILLIGIIFYILFKVTPDSNRSDYIASCYILTPKTKQKAYLYDGPNKISKEETVGDIVIPANIAVGPTINKYENYTGIFDSADLNDRNIDFENDLTLNPTYPYSLDEHRKYIKVITVRTLHKYKSIPGGKVFIAPNDKKFVPNNTATNTDYYTYSNKHLYYLKLSEFKLSFKKDYNISTTKKKICIGYIGRHSNE